MTPRERFLEVLVGLCAERGKPLNPFAIEEVEDILRDVKLEPLPPQT